MEFCKICGNPTYLEVVKTVDRPNEYTGDLCYGHMESNFQITLNGQSEEIRLLREISFKLDRIIELLSNKK